VATNSNQERAEQRSQAAFTPIPDPTVLTTQQLQREISTAREMVESAVSSLRQIIETRLSGMDRAIELLQAQSDRLPGHIAAEVSQLQKLHEEKFKSIATQFSERDTRTEQTSRDSKVAVDAALQAAKEAVGEQNKSNALAIAKSEATFTKQIDQIGVLISTGQKATDDKIDDMKSRLQAIESQKKGGGEMWVLIVGIAGFLMLGLSAVSVIMSLFRH
jgi:hypothetical protein